MVEELPVDDIRPNPRNPRENFTNIGELADSIEEHGLEVPVKVRPQDDGYELVHGERRLRAVKSLGKDTIRAEVEEMSDQRALEKSVVENLQREDVTELAEARSYQVLCDEFNMTQTEVAEKVGKSQGHVANRLRLLDLPDRLRRYISRKIISPSMALTIAGQWDNYNLTDFVVDHDLSVSELRDVISQLDEGQNRISLRRSIHVSNLEDAAIDDIQAWYDKHDIPEEERHTTGPFANFTLWANKNIDGYELPPPDEVTSRDEPIIDEVITPRLIYEEWSLCITGTVLVKNAIQEGYDGEIDVEMLFPRSIFELVEGTIECPTCGGTARCDGRTINCPECGGPKPESVGASGSDGGATTDG